MKNYQKTHIGTYRYKCRTSKTGFPISARGNYESMLSFEDLPPFKKLAELGRKWIHTKHFKPVLDRLVLDIDCEDLNTAFDVTKAIMQDLAEYSNCINVYFSGSKGFHIEVLTDKLDIVDTTAERPKDSCNPYVEFLNYFMDKYPQVDLSLKDVGTRIFRRHHTKHEKTGNYKILADVNAGLEDILKKSKANKDMVEPAEEFLEVEPALKLLNRFNKPLETANSNTPKLQLESSAGIYADVFNELKTNLHNKILLLGAGLNGYVSQSEVEAIYTELAKNTNIEDSTNAKGSFIEAYEYDKQPCNLGALRNHYEKHKLDLSNFIKLSKHLEYKIQSKNNARFNELMESYGNDWFEMLDTEMFDYVDNTRNIFIGVINSLSALMGYGSRFIVVNGGSEVGKSEYVKTIKKLMPRFKNLGSSTPASIRRQSEFEFDKKIVYLGDKGLKGKSQQSKDEFEGIYEVFGGLITDKEFVRDVVVGNEPMEFNLKSDGICVFYSEPYTNLRVFGAGDQYTTRSTFITVNPVEDGLSVFLQDNEDNQFYNIHKSYIQYIVNNPIQLKIGNEVKTELYYASNESLRTAKYLLGLFKAYCQYMQVGNPLITDVESFLKVFKPQIMVTIIEQMVYDKLYKNLNVIGGDDLDYKVYEDGSIQYEDMLMQVSGRKNKSFFTAKQIKTYFKRDFEDNKNLKDTIDQIPQILNNLYNAGLLEVLNWQYNNQNVYYIPYNEDMD